MYYENQVKEALKKYSIIKGKEFTLSSGKKSNVYCDVKKTMLNGELIYPIANLLYNKIFYSKNGYLIKNVAGVALGGCHLASITAIYGANIYNSLNVVYVRKESKSHGTKQLIEKSDNLSLNKIVLLEDVVTTGKSSIDAVNALVEAGYSVERIIAIVDRREVKSECLENIPFSSLFTLEELLD
jgi:orotate phosphoribosyltransferase